MNIGPYLLPNTCLVAPMAGVTDRPFRQLCKRLGAGYAVSEMVTSRPDLMRSLKTSQRANHDGEPGPIAVQIAGTDAITQLPFFITTCDYTLMGEELYAASAYLSREPLQLGSLKGQDYSKGFIILVLIVGTIASTAGSAFFINLFRTF